LVPTDKLLHGFHRYRTTNRRQNVDKPPEALLPFIFFTPLCGGLLPRHALYHRFVHVRARQRAHQEVYSTSETFFNWLNMMKKQGHFDQKKYFLAKDRIDPRLPSGFH
jgi:hypothetical protein